MVKLMEKMIEISRKDPEVHQLRGWTNNQHFMDLNKTKISISEIDHKKLFFSRDFTVA